MKGYKELIEKLRMAGRWIKHDDGSEETYLLSVDDCVEIADAIEELVKYAQKCERECKLAENLIARLERELAAARAEIDAAMIRGNY